MARFEPPPLRVLLCEDDEVNAVVLVSVIQRLGHDAVWVDSGSEALKALDRERFDLVLMDLMMPGMTGLETTRRIRQDRADLPIVALTALDDPEALRAGREAGMNGYIPKPVNSKDLERVLAEAVAGSSSI